MNATSKKSAVWSPAQALIPAKTMVIVYPIFITNAMLKGSAWWCRALVLMPAYKIAIAKIAPVLDAIL